MNKVEVKMDEKTVQYYITSLEDLCRTLQEENEQLKANRDTAIEFIDQELQYHLSPFDYKQVDEDINTLIGTLRSDSNE